MPIMNKNVENLFKQMFGIDGFSPTGISNHSNHVKKGDLFLAYPGIKSDGRLFITNAISSGAAAVIWEPDGFIWPEAFTINNFPMKNLRAMVGVIADYFYKSPSQKLWTVGVTGTNGKTSSVNWIASSLNKLGYATGSIGTMGISFKGNSAVTKNTTPDPLVLHNSLKNFVQAGAKCAAIEVSSHGLSQGRLEGVSFDSALFTNLSRDHLDYHETMEKYAQAKSHLFNWPTLRNAVINIDDSFGQHLIENIKKSGVNLISYGLKKGDVACLKFSHRKTGMKINVVTPWGKTIIDSNVIGAFNLHNFLGVLGILGSRGFDIQDAGAAISQCDAISGRMQSIRMPSNPLVVIDYAHTPDALEKSLTSLSSLLANGEQLFCVFGCGGDRDKGKRSEMGRVASRIADQCFVTSDNPRSENAASIINDILAGIESNCHVEQDRKVAIGKSINLAKDTDIVLIAGKGHEQYQDYGSEKFIFSDWETAQIFMQKKLREETSV